MKKCVVALTLAMVLGFGTAAFATQDLPLSAYISLDGWFWGPQEWGGQEICKAIWNWTPWQCTYR